MKNPFDQFDGAAAAVAEPNAFDQFDSPAAPEPAPEVNAFDRFDPKPLAPGARFDVAGAAQTAGATTASMAGDIRPLAVSAIRHGTGPAAGLLTLATTANPVAAVGMATAAGALGNAVANALEDRPGTMLENTSAGAVQGLGLAIPGVGRVTTPAFAANRPMVAMAAEVAAPAAAAGAVGTGLDALYQASQRGEVDWKQALTAGGITALIGGIGGGINALEAGRLSAIDRAGLMQYARQYGFQGQSFDELRAWYRARETAARAPRSRPAAPAEEGAPVPAGPVQALDDAYWTEQTAQARQPLALPPTQGAMVAPEPPTVGQGGSIPPPASISPAVAAPDAVAPTPVAPAVPAPSIPPALPAPAAGASLTPAPTAIQPVNGSPEPGGAGLAPIAPPDLPPAPTAAAGGEAPGTNQAPAGSDLAAQRSGGAGTVPATKGKGKRRSLGPRPDGAYDIIDFIEERGGIPARPPGAKGGEWDDYRGVFDTPQGRLLVDGKKRGKGIDQWLRDNAGETPFAHLEGDVPAFYAEVRRALDDRARLKQHVKTEQTVATFMTAALDGKGRAPREPRAGEPILSDELKVGDELRLKGQDFEAVRVNEDGSVVIKDGPRVPPLTIPPGAPIYADKGSVNIKPAVDDAMDWPEPEPPAAPPPAPAPAPGPGQWFTEEEVGFNLASEEQRAPTAPAAPAAQTGEMFGAEVRSTAPTEMDRRNEAARAARGSAASPDFAAAPPNQPPQALPPPAQDGEFSQLPIELPEAVQFFKILSLGQYPKVRERLRILHGQAAGVFKYVEGDPRSGSIELRADIFNLLTLEQKQELLRQAVAYAHELHRVDPAVNQREATRAKFEELVRAAEREAIAAGPRRALATFWHEIGHFIDFLPEGTLKRGNILGRIASLNRYLKGYLGKHPGITAEPPTSAERAALRRQAEQELESSLSTVVETIRREEPVYREIPITADTITGIVKNLAREEFPEFYDWFAKLDRKTKADVLRQAMKGMVDPRAAQFSRREATGEVRVTEEQVTRTTGTPATPEAIKARYEQLLRAELERRGLINVKEIREELSRAIAWWRGTETIPDYFKSAPEMWADAMSIFFNNPRGLAERAPKFYESLMAWMSAKPEVAREYRRFQRDIASGQIHRDRVANLRDMFARDEEAGRLLDEAMAKRSWWASLDALRLVADRQFGPIERRIGRNPRDIAGQRALAALGDYRYRVTGWEAYALELRNQVEVPLAEAGLSHMDMAEYLFHQRIVEGAYRNRAAPLGWNPKNSSERLAEMQATLGPARWQALVGAQQALRQVYEKHVVRLLHESGTMSPELAQAVDQEVFYAPFNQARTFTGGSLDSIEQLIKLHYGNEAAGQIYGAVGNLGEIRSPYVQMHHRAFGLISMAYRQIAVKRMVAWLREHEPLSVADAPMKWNGRALEPVRVDNDRVTTLYMLNGGKVEAVYVPAVFGEMFKSGGPIEMAVIGTAHKMLSIPKALLTELNPGFWPVAFAKDVWTAAVQTPAGARILRELPRAYLAAWRTFYGRPDPLAQRVLDRRMVISRADSRGEHLGHSDEMTRILLRLGKSPVAWGAEVGRVERALRTFWQWWAQQGQVFERTVKIATMQALDRAAPDLPEWRKRELVRERGGSPDFLSKGRWARVIELSFSMMFFNAWKEGVRSMKRAATEDPRGFWSKFAATAGAAGALLWAMESGLVGEGEKAEDYRDMLRSIPERDKLRGMVIPLGWVDRENGKVAYLTLPFPDNLRWAHALQRKALQSTASGAVPSGEGMSSFLAYQGQDLPGENPIVTAVQELYAYFIEGRNPYDEFTGRPALDETAVQAGAAGPEALKRAAANMTGGIVYRHKPERPGEQLSRLEEMLRLPGISNLVGRWIRVSNRGLDEFYQGSRQPVEKEQASLRLIGEEMIARSLKGEPWASEHLSLVSESDYLANYISEAAPRLAMQADSPFLRALTQARTSAEKLAVVRAENERQQARLRRLDRTGAIANPVPLPP